MVIQASRIVSQIFWRIPNWYKHLVAYHTSKYDWIGIPLLQIIAQLYRSVSDCLLEKLLSSEFCQLEVRITGGF